MKKIIYILALTLLTAYVPERIYAIATENVGPNTNYQLHNVNIPVGCGGCIDNAIPQGNTGSLNWTLFQNDGTRQYQEKIQLPVFQIRYERPCEEPLCVTITGIRTPVVLAPCRTTTKTQQQYWAFYETQLTDANQPTNMDTNTYQSYLQSGPHYIILSAHELRYNELESTLEGRHTQKGDAYQLTLTDNQMYLYRLLAETSSSWAERTWTLKAGDPWVDPNSTCCPDPNTIFNSKIGGCCPPNHMIDDVTGECIPCPAGTTYDSVQLACINACPSDATYNATTQTCECNNGADFNTVTQSCCTGGTIYDPSTGIKTCVCPQGQVENTVGQCTGPCTGGKIFDASGTCVCPQGQVENTVGQCVGPCTGGKNI